MKSPGKRSGLWVRVGLYVGIGATVAGAAWAQPPRRARWLTVAAPGPLINGPIRVAPVNGTNALPARSYDACLVQTPEIDPRFTVAARGTDDAIIVPAPVAGLVRGMLVPRR
jgi:hypothetical protein